MPPESQTITGPMEAWAKAHEREFVAAGLPGWWGDALSFARENDAACLLLVRENDRLHAHIGEQDDITRNLIAALEDLMVVGSAATGFLMSDFARMHEAVEELMGRPVFTHEMGVASIAAEIRERAKPRFVEVLAEARAALERAKAAR